MPKKTGSGCGGSVLNRKPKPPSPHPLPQALYPKVFPGEDPGIPETPPGEASRGHPDQMPTPPQLVPLDAVEQQLHSKLLWMTKLLTLSLRESLVTLQRKTSSATTLFFGSWPKAHDHR